MSDDTVDFFVSYTGIAAPMAEWIAWQLEEGPKGQSVSPSAQERYAGGW